MAASVHEISNLIDPVAVAAGCEASLLGHKVEDGTTSPSGWSTRTRGVT